jgi:hypothetical protein
LAPSYAEKIEFYAETRTFAKTGSGQTQEECNKTSSFLQGRPGSSRATTTA